MGRKAHETYGGRAAILFGGDHLGGAPESLSRLVLVSLGPARGEAESHLHEIQSFNQSPACR